MSEPEPNAMADEPKESAATDEPAASVASPAADASTTPAEASPIATAPDAASTATTTAAPTYTFEKTDDPLFEALWAKVMEHWDDDKVHGSALEYAVNGERLPDLAGRYRLLKDDPVKGARAKKRLDAIVFAATQLMMSMKTSTTSAIPLPITMSVFGLFLFAVAFVAYAMLHRS